MQTIQIISPTLDYYLERVRALSYVNLGDADSWVKLDEKNIPGEDDRNEFIFIKMALWDKLIEKDYFYDSYESSPPERCEILEPGVNPGSSIFGGVNWAHMTMQNL